MERSRRYQPFQGHHFRCTVRMCPPCFGEPRLRKPAQGVCYLVILSTVCGSVWMYQIGVFRLLLEVNATHAVRYHRRLFRSLRKPNSGKLGRTKVMTKPESTRDGSGSRSSTSGKMYQSGLLAEIMET